jgi:hypothetical protein
VGLPLVSIQQLLDNDAPVTLVDETGSLGKFIEFLHKQALMELVCEPALATVPGRTVSISLDGGDVCEPDELGVAHNKAPGSAIRFDCTPQVAEGGRLDLQIRFRQTEGTSAGSCDSAGRDATGSGALLEIETRVEIEPGQRVILCGRRCREKLDEDIGVLVLLAAELAGSPHVATAAQ